MGHSKALGHIQQKDWGRRVLAKVDVTNSSHAFLLWWIDQKPIDIERKTDRLRNLWASINWFLLRRIKQNSCEVRNG